MAVDGYDATRQVAFTSCAVPTILGPLKRHLRDTAWRARAICTRVDAVTDRHTLHPLLAALPARQRRILALRYFADMSQAEIAAQIG